MIYVTDSFKNNTSNNNSSGMDIFGIGSAIGGIASAFGTAAAARQNRKAQEETNKANLLLAKQQNDWNIQQWEREMAYNSPANKLKLLEDAGLNPIWYGSNLGPTETQAPKSADLANQVAPQLDAGAIGSSLGTLTSSLIAAGQYNLQRKQQDLESRKIDIEERRLGIESAKTTQDIEESKARVENLTQTLDNLKKEGKLTDAQYEIAVKQLTIMDDEHEKYQEEIKGIKLDNKQKEIFVKQYAEQLAAELNIKKEQARELAALVEYYLNSADKVATEAYGQKLINWLTEELGYPEKLASIIAGGGNLLSSLIRGGVIATNVDGSSDDGNNRYTKRPRNTNSTTNPQYNDDKGPKRKGGIYFDVPIHKPKSWNPFDF